MHILVDKMWFRLRRAIVTYESRTTALRVPVGDVERQVLGTCSRTLRGPRNQRGGKRRHPGREDVVQNERKVTLSAQSQVSSTVSAVSRRTRQLRTAACPQRYRQPTTRFVNTFNAAIQEELYFFKKRAMTTSAISAIWAVTEGLLLSATFFHLQYRCAQNRVLKGL